MPSAGSVWDRRTMRMIVSDWYGMPMGMRLRIETREEEIEAYEAEHPEVPEPLWEFVNHPLRQVRMWARRPDCVDLLVWCEASQSPKLVQDVYFKDAYASESEWYNAILDCVKDPTKRVWFAFHEE